MINQTTTSYNEKWTALHHRLHSAMGKLINQDDLTVQEGERLRTLWDVTAWMQEIEINAKTVQLPIGQIKRGE